MMTSRASLWEHKGHSTTTRAGSTVEVSDELDVGTVINDDNEDNDEEDDVDEADIDEEESDEEESDEEDVVFVVDAAAEDVE